MISIQYFLINIMFYLCLPFYLLQTLFLEIIIRLTKNDKLINYVRDTHNYGLFTFSTKKYNPFIRNKRQLSMYVNIIDDDTNILWPSSVFTFMSFNRPNKFIHDFNIKNDLFTYASKLPKNYCIIDGGAHIGDGAIPIAHALTYIGRSDIIVYAIEPSEYKCNFIKKIAKINNIHNIKVLNYGLSDTNTQCKSYQCNSISNTGSMTWIYSPKGSHFVTIDYLFDNNIISHNIGAIHLDVEGYETNAIKGSKNILNKFKPYLSLERFEENNIISLLPTDYSFKIKLGFNYIYSID